MGILKLKKMNKKIWFQQKIYGYGIRPCSWEGWLLTLIYAGLLSSVGIYLFEFSGFIPAMTMAIFLLIVFISVFALINLTSDRTEGEMKWRWPKK